MMDKIKGTQTEKNIRAAFQGESMARSKYAFYEEQARKEGNIEVADMFARMIRNETAHSKIWYKLMYGPIADSAANIQEAAKGENDEWTSMYPEFAKKAREEGLEDVARLFEQVAAIEKEHERTFLRSFMGLKTKGASDQKNEEAAKAAEEPKKLKQVYRCMFCGAVFDERPDVCAVCEAIGSFENAMVEE